MPFAYLGTMFLMWVLFTGSLSSTLIHEENAKVIESEKKSAYLTEVPTQASDDPIKALQERAIALHNTVVTSSIGVQYLATLEGATNTQGVAFQGGVTANVPEVTTEEPSVLGKLFNLVTNTKTEVATYALRTFVMGNGTIIYPSGVMCGTICTVSFTENTSATLIAVPGPGSTFTGWTGACSGTGSCTVKMTALREATATFASVAQVPTVQPQIKPSTKTLSATEVATHSTPADCWIIVDKNVYSVSAYLAMHPGGKSTITNVCGKDASAVFTNRGGTGKHSNSAWNLLGTFLVGSLPGAVVPVKSALSGYSEAQVASHASVSDCWVIVNDNVYSVTSYLSMHPGGKSIILNLCGKDATSEFTTRGGTGAHTSYAWSILGGYIVGSLSIAIPSAPVVAPVTTTATAAATKEYTASDVSKHNSPADCWLTINNTIYSVAGYMNMHPGGTSVIKAVCGKDATTVFTSRGGTGAHSVSAWNMLGAYSVGIIAGTKPIAAPAAVTPTPAAAVPKATPASTYTTAQVSAHNSVADCWLIINNNVYDVTSYISSHPGGTNVIKNVCGKESTTAFNTKGYGVPHSTYAWSLLGGYIVGTIAGTVPVPAPAPTPVTPPTPVPVPTPVTTGSYTLAQVATHNISTNCWIIVDNNIYAVSAYSSMHPGGAAIINAFCGKDASSDFASRGGTGAHSAYAWSALGGYLIGSVTGTTPTPIPTPVPTPTTPTPVTPPTPVPAVTYDMTQVAAHNATTDCWIVVNNVIYSVGAYISMHPGGATAISNVCGKEATTAFNTKGYGAPHSASAWGILGTYSIGTVTGTIPVPNPAPTPTPTTPAPTPVTPGGPYTAAQIMTHNTASDCWIVVGTKVYSVGAYSAVHPGGIAAITNLCGQDATTGFNTKNGAGTHSAGAITSLGGLFIGNLSGAAPTPPTTPPPAPVTPTYTASQISAHSSASDCWIVIGTNVYSVGAYLMSHPGGAYAISKSCGKNASTEWATKGGYSTTNKPRTHSAGASTSLGGFLVGTLSGTAPSATPLNPAPTTAITAAQIQAHNTSSDCWMSIGTSVYSMGLFAPLHPGGTGKITDLCGMDGTTGFNNEHSGSASVKNGLGGMKIGVLSGPAPVNTFTLTVTKTGNGTVTSSPAGISCGGTCTASYNSGTSVTLTAVPTTKNVFTSWTSSCSGSTNPVCTVTMSKARSAKANFTASSTAP